MTDLIFFQFSKTCLGFILKNAVKLVSIKVCVKSLKTGSCCISTKKIDISGVACSQTKSEWLWVVALHKPTAAPGKSCDLQGTWAHPGHHHVAPRGAWGHHWARWPPLHGLCQGVGRSEENLAHIQKNQDLNFSGEKAAPGGEEEGVGCHPGWLKSGLWHWREGLWQIAESTLVCLPV